MKPEKMEIKKKTCHINSYNYKSKYNMLSGTISLVIKYDNAFKTDTSIYNHSRNDNEEPKNS